MAGLEVAGVTTLRAAAALLAGGALPPLPPEQRRRGHPASRPTCGTCAARREAVFALEVAAAGGHHLLLEGPPGTGKTMLARRLPAILPAMTRAEALAVTRIHSVAGLHAHGLVGDPPVSGSASHDLRRRSGRRRVTTPPR